MLAFARRLLAGQPVSVEFIGGSITNHGQRPHGFAALFREWLAAAFPHSSQHVLVGAASSGATAEFTARCAMYTRVERSGVDLVVLEHAVNLLGEAQPAEVEVLLRTLLRRAPAPPRAPGKPRRERLTRADERRPRCAVGSARTGEGA